MAFLATRDAARARAFYETTLGLRVSAEDDFALVLEAPNVTIRIQKVESLTPAPFTALGWEVADLEGVVTRLKARGVCFQTYPGLGQDPLGIWRAPSGARVAWFGDPDGYTLSLTQLG